MVRSVSRQSTHPARMPSLPAPAAAVRANGNSFARALLLPGLLAALWSTASALTLNDFADYQVLQRDIGGTSKIVTIRGGCEDPRWKRIDARVLRRGTASVVAGWATVDSTPGKKTLRSTKPTSRP